MALDRSKLHKGFQSYLGAAEKNSGKTYDDMALVLSKSGLKTHGDQRSLLMDKLKLGHGHANAVVHIWREYDGGDAMMGTSSAITKPGKKAAAKKPAKAPVKAAKKAPAKKAAVKKPAKKK
jgi:Domain of unknown function (DUF4287)